MAEQTQQTSVKEPWAGNLPCCHGPKDGCAAHNWNRVPIFWNPSLPSSVKPVTDNFFKSFLSKKDAKQGQPEPKPTFVLSLPQTPSTQEPLPLIHGSVPYTLSFYHLHAITTSPSPATLLPFITCHGVTNSHSLKWQITPLLTPTRDLLLAHTYTLPISLPFGAAATLSDTSNYSYQKIPLLSPVHNIYSFRACPHMTRHLRTLRLKVAKGVASIRIEYALKNIVLGQEFRDEWRSDEGRQPLDMACGMCHTDLGMVFEEDVKQGEVRVTVKVWKDLGGSAAGGEKWEAARGGEAVKREREDFGRVRRAYEELLGGTAVVDRETDVDEVAGGNEPAVGKRLVLEESQEVVDDGQHVADGMQPPPAYTP
ncbi:hypothetical protein N657DRAFT_650166 [Parathielavia appendiculata]|uniref:Uncharacterized protein n=1 Tax=Parathielavia appendiculata TaxID=2587402 RepID=A0AAN6YZ26_9PEZI|nr:hypothetical protein N657DRAFT_650166 [Parathielavia appendiculata]